MHIITMNLFKYLIKHIDFDIDKKFVEQFYQIQKNKYKKTNPDLMSIWILCLNG